MFFNIFQKNWNTFCKINKGNPHIETNRFKMSQSFELKAVVEKNAVEVKKIKINRKVKQPAVKKISVWMNVSRTPKEKPQTFVWENIEDISDDESSTPQAAGKRLSMMKATRDQIRRRYYENNLDEFHRAGLFLNLSQPKPLETHENYSYEVQSTYAHSIRV